MKKVLLPGIIGGLAVFIWSFVSHMALPVGTMGIKTIPSAEDKVIGAMKDNIPEDGLYFMPGHDLNRQPTDAEKEKYRKGPTAFLVYHTTGVEMITAGQLLRQLLFQILGGLIAAFIVSLTVASLGVRALAVALIGLFSWLTVNLPHWNWYRFPAAFTIGAGIDNVIGWLLGGLLIAWLVQRAEKRAAAV